MKPILTLLAVLLCAAFVQAQNPISNLMVYSKPLLKQATGNAFNVTKLQETQLVITLSDTANISSFSIKLGTISGSSDIIQKTFTYATEGVFSDGTSYTRDGLSVKISLGQHPAVPHYYAEVSPVVNGISQQATTFHN